MKIQNVTNPFYEDIQRNGIIIDVPRKTVQGRPITNPYYARIRAAGGIRIGRPRRGEKRRPTIVQSVRLPPELWKRVEAQAKREKITVSEALREGALIWLRS